MRDEVTTRPEAEKHFAISLFVYIMLTQLAYLFPPGLRNDYLFSHTVVFISLLCGIMYLAYCYAPLHCNNIKKLNIIGYCFAGVVLCLIVNYPYNILNHLHSKPQIFQYFVSYNILGKVYLVFLLSIVGPLLEEIYYRGYLYNIVKKRFGVLGGVILSAFLYMFMHNFSVDILYLFLPGVIYAVVYEKTKTIWASTIVHGLNNGLWFYLVYYA